MFGAICAPASSRTGSPRSRSWRARSSRARATAPPPEPASRTSSKGGSTSLYGRRVSPRRRSSNGSAPCSPRRPRAGAGASSISSSAAASRPPLRPRCSRSCPTSRCTPSRPAERRSWSSASCSGTWRDTPGSAMPRAASRRAARSPTWWRSCSRATRPRPSPGIAAWAVRVWRSTPPRRLTTRFRRTPASSASAATPSGGFRPTTAAGWTSRRCPALSRRTAPPGVRPMLVNATAGTTVRGAFDPIREIAGVAREHGAWLHVDGALGASLVLCPARRDLVDGIELADSLAWDPHKMMGVPLQCSVLLVARPGALGAEPRRDRRLPVPGARRRAQPRPSLDPVRPPQRRAQALGRLAAARRPRLGRADPAPARSGPPGRREDRRRPGASSCSSSHPRSTSASKCAAATARRSATGSTAKGGSRSATAPSAAGARCAWCASTPTSTRPTWTRSWARSGPRRSRSLRRAPERGAPQGA